MWRTSHSQTPTPPQPHHHTLPERLAELRHTFSEAVIGVPVARCSVCHAELEPIDMARGYCSDLDACTCRALSQRCW